MLRTLLYLGTFYDAHTDNWLASFENPRAGAALRRLSNNLHWNISNSFDHVCLRHLTHLDLLHGTKWIRFTGWENFLAHFALACSFTGSLAQLAQERILPALPAVLYVALGYLREV